MPGDRYHRARWIPLPTPSEAAIQVALLAVIADKTRQEDTSQIESDFSEKGFLTPPGESPVTAAPPILEKSSTAPATPVVVVDRLEDLAAQDYAAFCLDVRTVHSVGEQE